MTVRSGYAAGVSGQAYLRASTADRERALDVLKAGYAEGRLTKDEYDDRAGQAFTARTLGELARITTDLPGGHPGAPAWPTAPPGTNPLAVASLLCGLGQPFTGFLSTIPAIVLGHMARREIRRTGQDGSGLATAGLVLGWSGAILILLALVLFVALVSLVARL